MSSVHKDHLLPTAIRKIAFNYPTIFFVTGSEEVVKKLVENGVRKSNIFILKSHKWFDIGIAKLKLEPLTHDTPNYAVSIEYKDKKCIYIVDTANVDNIKAKDYDLYLIESNYKRDILEEHLQTCTEEDRIYLERVPNTHLSFEAANSFLIENMGENSVYEYIHQSAYNFKGEE